MFSKRSRGPVPVQVVGTHPITKLEYYSKHGRNWFIALLVFSIIALILGALVLGGVIAYPVEYTLNDAFATGPNNNLAILLEQYGYQLKQFLLANPTLIKDLEGLVQVKPMAYEMVETVINPKQATLDTIGTWMVIVSSITTLVSIAGVVVFSYLFKLDRPVSNKKEQRFYRQLEKAEYRAALRTQKINKAKANQELKAKMKADFKSKKAK